MSTDPTIEDFANSQKPRPNSRWSPSRQIGPIVQATKNDPRLAQYMKSIASDSAVSEEEEEEDEEEEEVIAPTGKQELNQPCQHDQQSRADAKIDQSPKPSYSKSPTTSLDHLRSHLVSPQHSIIDYKSPKISSRLQPSNQASGTYPSQRRHAPRYRNPHSPAATNVQTPLPQLGLSNEIVQLIQQNHPVAQPRDPSGRVSEGQDLDQPLQIGDEVHLVDTTKNDLTGHVTYRITGIDQAGQCLIAPLPRPLCANPDQLIRAPVPHGSHASVFEPHVHMVNGKQSVTIDETDFGVVRSRIVKDGQRLYTVTSLTNQGVMYENLSDSQIAPGWM